MVTVVCGHLCNKCRGIEKWNKRVCEKVWDQWALW